MVTLSDVITINFSGVNPLNAIPMQVALSQTIAQALPELMLEIRHLATTLATPNLKDKKWRLAIATKQRELAKHVAILRKQVLAQCEELGSQLDTRYHALSSTLETVSHHLQQGVVDLAGKTSSASLKRNIQHLGQRISHDYEDLVAHVKALRIWKKQETAKMRAIRVPRPMRSLLHVVTGIFIVFAYHFIFTREQGLVILGSVAVAFTGLEISRRFSKRLNDFMIDKIFGLISRPRERYQVNSATYYLVTMFFIVLIAPMHAVCLALLVLAFGDPIASIIGSRWGKVRLYNDKSLEGSLGFFFSALLISFIYIAIATTLSPLSAIALAFSLAIVGTLTELFSNRLDDNMTIQLICALIAMWWF